jgi:hypothetical protein
VAGLPSPATKTLEIIMNHVIITSILLALAVVAKAQPKDNLINQEREEKSDGKRKVAK